jgi:drug/metabolite transporter (DMT)-like permease
MEKPVTGQKAISFSIAMWLLLLVLCWATNSVVIKFIVEDMPSAWAAFLRFAIAYPFVAAFILYQKTNLRVTTKQLLLCVSISVMTFFQIMLFNIGSQYTTGGRVTMLIFTYPLIIPFIAHFLLKGEKLERKTVIGTLIAFIGLLIPLYDTLTHDTPTLKGDILEFSSSIVLALLIVTNKYAFSIINKWTVFFWQSTANVLFFGIAALMTPGFSPETIGKNAWWSLGFQIFIISVFAFLSYQYILSKHNSSKVSIFFFATPLFGMLLGGLLHNEAFEIALFLGCISVALGILISNSPKKTERKNGSSIRTKTC